MAAVAGAKTIAHRVLFYQKITRAGVDYYEFVVPFHVVRLAHENGLRGGNTFLEPKNFLTWGHASLYPGSSPSLSSTEIIDEIHEIRQLDDYSLYLGEKPQDASDPIILHSFCRWPVT